MKALLFLLFFIVAFYSVSAQKIDSSTTEENFYKMSLEEILDVKITVDSKFEYEKKNSPSINTVITSEEITLMGARNLMDVLQTVPGLSISVGGIPYYGVNIRGNSSNFGKILVLLDGNTLNESSFGLAHIGDRININQIERIEIIHGAGSALYGGWAEYGVINIVTKKEVNGVSFKAGIDEYQLSYKGGAYVNEQIGNFSVSASMYSGNVEIRKDTVYSKQIDTNYFYSRYSERPLLMSIGVGYKDLSLKYMFDGYKTDFHFPIEGGYNSAIDFDMEKVVLSYDHKISNNKKVLAKLDATWNHPYNFYINQNPVATHFNKTFKAQTVYSETINDHLKWVAGLEGVYNYGYYENFFFVDRRQGEYYTISPFLSVEYKYKNFLTTAGFRYSYNTVYQSAYSPRLSMRYNVGAFYSKAMFNYAYRPPAIGELIFVTNIQPETTTTYEVQLGIDKPHFKTSLSYYNILSRNTISYTSVINMIPTGINGAQTGTAGLEGELKYVYNKRLSFLFNFSQVLENFNKVEDYNAGDGYNLGMPLTTMYYRISYMLFPEFYITPSFQYIGNIKAVKDDKGVKDFAPVNILNCNLSYSQLKKDMRITYGLGVVNILDQKQFYHTPYKDLGASLPGNQRQLVVSLEIEF